MINVKVYNFRIPDGSSFAFSVTEYQPRGSENFYRKSSNLINEIFLSDKYKMYNFRTFSNLFFYISCKYRANVVRKSL